MHARLFAHRRDTAGDHVFHVGGVEPVTPAQGLEHLPEELLRVHAR